MNGKFRQVEKSFDFWAAVFSPWLSPSKSGSALDFTKTLLLIPPLYSRRVGNVGFGDGRHGFRLQRPVETATPAKPSTAKSGSGTAGPAPSAQRSQPSASSDQDGNRNGYRPRRGWQTDVRCGCYRQGHAHGHGDGYRRLLCTQGASQRRAVRSAFSAIRRQEVFVGSKSTIDITLVDEAQAIDGGRRHGFGPQTRREIARLRRLQGRR